MAGVEIGDMKVGCGVGWFQGDEVMFAATGDAIDAEAYGSGGEGLAPELEFLVDDLPSGAGIFEVLGFQPEGVISEAGVVEDEDYGGGIDFEGDVGGGECMQVIAGEVGFDLLAGEVLEFFRFVGLAKSAGDSGDGIMH